MRKIDDMLRALLLGMALVVACGGGSDELQSQPAGEPAKDAGKVLEVSGTVTAAHTGSWRTLEVGNRVTSDDVIDTGTNGSIVIELFHNNARWSLESGLKTRVDESVAWKLPKQEVADKVEHASSAAGRHGDRQAADTSVSARGRGDRLNFADEEDGAGEARPSAEAKPEKPATAGTTGGGAKGPKPAASATKPKTESMKQPEPPKPQPESMKQPEPPKPPAGGGSCDEVSCVLSNYEGACCSKFKKSGNAPRGPAAPSDLPDVPDKQAIVSAMAIVKPKIMACNTDPNVKGTVKIKIKIRPDGKLDSATIAQTPDPKLDACVLAAVKDIKMPVSKSGVTFSYPIIIN